MSVKTAYIAKLGKGYKISDHFTLGEMRCKDGSDKVLYSTDLLDKLEELRAYGSFTITINSGYRTAAYNKKIGGASASQHIKGTAADIVVKKDGKVVNARLICCLCQTLGFKGIGYISANAAHVDMRASGSYRGDERSGYGNNVSDFYRYFGLSKIDIDKYKAAPAAGKTEEKDMTEEQVRAIVRQELNGFGQDQLPSNWAVTELQEAKDAGITDGINPDSYVTREQAAVMSVRAAKSIGIKTK